MPEKVCITMTEISLVMIQNKVSWAITGRNVTLALTEKACAIMTEKTCLSMTEILVVTQRRFPVTLTGKVCVTITNKKVPLTTTESFLLPLTLNLQENLHTSSSIYIIHQTSK